MDQRVDDDRRPDSERRSGQPPGTAPARGETEKQGVERSVFRKRRGLFMALAIGAIIALAASLLWWLNARQYESTDDAFIDARTVQISAQVAAAIVDVPVND